MVKVLPERESLFGSAWYQLHHSTIKLGFKRFQIVTWFGSMGYRLFKGETIKQGCYCPLCKGEMEQDHYIGDEHWVKDLGSPAYGKVVLRDEFDVGGEPNFIRRGDVE